jgi:hypothetical protein
MGCGSRGVTSLVGLGKALFCQFQLFASNYCGSRGVTSLVGLGKAQGFAFFRNL